MARVGGVMNKSDLDGCCSAGVVQMLMIAHLVTIIISDLFLKIIVIPLNDNIMCMSKTVFSLTVGRSNFTPKYSPSLSSQTSNFKFKPDDFSHPMLICSWSCHPLLLYLCSQDLIF